MAAINKLTEVAIRQAKPKDNSYRISDGGGLYLEVMPNGSKYWRLKYRFGGKEKRLAEGVAPATIGKLRWIIEQKLSPYIGKLPVSEITPVKLLAPLRQIESEGLHETANKAKRVAGQVMRYAVGLGLVDRDPSQDLRDALVTAKTNHRAAITAPIELGKILVRMDSYNGTPEIKAALRLTPILFQRPGEIRHMEWSEIN